MNRKTSPPTPLLKERGAMKIIDFVKLCAFAPSWQKTIASLHPCELCVKPYSAVKKFVNS